MASTASPSSAGSSPAANIAPVSPLSALNMASMTPNFMAPVSTVSIGPTKNWVVPPRPRPGRKPATDTPPTKRKAQNRAAQRAFRERRAARVGELEEQLKETEEERQKRHGEMNDQIIEQEAKISRLLDDAQRLIVERDLLQHRLGELQHKYEREAREKEEALVEISYLRHGARYTGTDAVPLPPRRRRNPLVLEVSGHLRHTGASEPTRCGNCKSATSCMCVEATLSIVDSNCGNCASNGHCQCLEDILKGPIPTDAPQILSKRPRSGSSNLIEFKRPRVSIGRPYSTETDPTTKLATKSTPSQERLFQEQTTTSRTVGESCGFCADGTYCVCAEAAAASSAGLESQENRLAPILSEVTPPPSENDVNSSDITGYKPPLLHPNHRAHHAVESTGSFPTFAMLNVSSPSKLGTKYAGLCVNGPGSCKQCQEDPKSGLFCRSLAAMNVASSSSAEDVSDACCGERSSQGGCCKSQGNTAPILSCTDTYKTLASHKNFDQASDDLGNWLPKLQTFSGRYEGRAPLDIEAASVMNVIKYFDVRFGRN